MQDPPCPIVDEPRGSTYVAPRHVVEVRFKSWSAQSLLRQPVFLRWRDDKPPEECLRPGEEAGAAPQKREAAEAANVVVDKTVRFTNLDQGFLAGLGSEPGRLHQGRPHRLLPERGPLVPALPRGPADHAHPLSRRHQRQELLPEGRAALHPRLDAHGAAVERGHGKGTRPDHRRRPVAGDLETLLFIANLGAIVLHAWNARASDPARPDWIILDLDPKEAPFEHVITLAQEAKALCDEIGLPCFAKTTGSSGLHVLLPTGGALTHEQCKTFAELLARVIVTRRDTIATIVRIPAHRGGKVYIDFLQNGHGKLLVAPFSVRPLPGAPVSMPLEWSEVREGLDPAAVHDRERDSPTQNPGPDPLLGVLKEKPDLLGALGKLGERLG